MMQANPVQATLSGLLSQLLSGGTVEAGVLESVEGGDFVESMAGQLKALMIQWGEDPDTVAAIDNGALLSQFLALVQGQAVPLDGHVPLGLGVMDDSLTTLAGSRDGSETDAAIDETGDRTSGSLCSLPSFVLEQLAVSNQLGRADAPASGSSSLADGSRGLVTNRFDAALAAEWSPISPEGLSEPAAGSAGAVGGLTALRPWPQGLVTNRFDAALAAEGSPIGPEGLSEPAAGSAGSDGSLGLEIMAAGTSDGDEALASWILKSVPSVLAPELGMGSSSEPTGTLDRLSAQDGGTSIRDSLLAFLMKGEVRTGQSDESDPLSDSLNPSPELGLAGSARIAPAAVDSPSGGVSARSLDLSELLRPGGETRLAEQLKWFLRGGVEAAEMKLHPPSLGALDVRVSMDGDRTQVQFVSSHPIVREVLEAALPRLREALERDGLSLGNVSVSDRSAEGRDGTDREAPTGRGHWPADTEEGGLEEPVGSVVDSTLSALARRLDLYI
ncbi:flagellar hook-length control protein FliK [Thiocystis violacea]|uniref:flagellar hook-length control protein FliK n=1 Tax=Thiocystis violacea TaxID=13725 RepID=UPI001902DD78|nr:flagellar hook-length control protein FliK [Thiocystis violacea]MBK1716706.1 hypothetical protein [Thiocystis violacea]